MGYKSKKNNPPHRGCFLEFNAKYSSDGYNIAKKYTRRNDKMNVRKNGMAEG